MGWLTDIGNVAVGAIERDREITKEDLIIRGENLKANQQLLVDQKKKKYERELESYYKEKEKFDDTEKMNQLFSDKAISPDAYAAFALSQTIPKWDTIPDKRKIKMIGSFKGKTFDYELTGSAAEINKKAASAITLINDETAKAIKDAKGNSFLINQILRKKERVEKDIYASIEEQLKAADAVKMTSRGVNKDNVGLDVIVSDGVAGNLQAIFEHNDGKWLTQYDSAVKKSEWAGITQEKTILAAVAAGTVKGFNTEPFIEKNDQGEVEGWTQNGQPFYNTVEQTYKTLHDNLDNKRAIITSFNYNNIIGGANINTGKLNDKTFSIISQRANVAKIDGNSVFSMIPIGVVNRNNQFIVDGQVFSLDEVNNEEMTKAMTLYNSYLEKTATKNVKGKENIFGNVPNTAWVNAWNNLQNNMSSNRNFNKDSKETDFAYEFKKELIDKLNLKSSIEGEVEIAPDKKIVKDEKVIKVDKEEKKKIDTGKPTVKDNIIFFKTKEGDHEVPFEKLDESQIEELKEKVPDIYKEYEIWLQKNTKVYKKKKYQKNIEDYKVAPDEMHWTRVGEGTLIENMISTFRITGDNFEKYRDKTDTEIFNELVERGWIIKK